LWGSDLDGLTLGGLDLDLLGDGELGEVGGLVALLGPLLDLLVQVLAGGEGVGHGRRVVVLAQVPVVHVGSGEGATLLVDHDDRVGVDPLLLEVGHRAGEELGALEGTTGVTELLAILDLRHFRSPKRRVYCQDEQRCPSLQFTVLQPLRERNCPPINAFQRGNKIKDTLWADNYACD